MRDQGSWDIKTSVGSTALFVAAARGLAARRPDPIAVDRFAEVFCVAAGDEWAALFTGDPAATAEHPLRSADFGIPFQNFQAARTRWFDDYCAAAVATGVRQIVILAAGLDARAYRLPWPAGTTVYELDQPLVLEFKRSVLAAHGDRPVARRREVPVDLRTDWPAALRAAGFDPTAPTAWLVEGLLIYLSPAEQDVLYERIESLSAPGSFVGVEQMDPIDPEVYRAMLEAQDQPGGDQAAWASLIHNEPHSEAVAWFGARGWSGTATKLSDLLASLGHPAPEVPAGFLMPGLVSLVTVAKG
ncbi:SAM-dependent methyltransferase [Nocardia stercoris]|uniref:S-adenosyl-L-methionine-dependent methyltransferase n=1 Tax=Nocardia stercoris TaxID=2483361 RepID=A0A3M2LG15_9NOCA|nr:SAM-dependent methyltransferase [Nocardia stercoris]RMI33658.1 SAM-dependent methyltransferase [Nocardia stercoris]